MSVPDLAKRLYERFGSWAKVARALNISDAAVYAWRDGRTIPGFDFVDRFAAALDLPREEIRQVLIRAREERDTRGGTGQHLNQSAPKKPPARASSRLHRGNYSPVYQAG
jgi:transcriptional regulator with XRE-family HTH domain